MDVERTLLSRAISGRMLDTLFEWEIDPADFEDESCREVYATCMKHFARYGEPPGPEAVHDAHPDYPIVVSGESIDYLMDRFVRAVKRRRAIELYRDFGDACDDPERIDEIDVVAMEMASALMDIIPRPRVGRWADEKRIEDYLKEQALGRGKGIPTGFPEVDHWTTGVQPTDLVAVAGWQNSGKSMVMQRMAWNVFAVSHKRPLYITLEMSADECHQRWDSMATGIQHRALRAMEVEQGSEEFERWKSILREAEKFRSERDILVVDDLGSCTPDRVLVEMRKYDPDVVFVDYLELMDAPRAGVDEWQGVNAIGKQLKRNARLKISGKNIPIVVACQTNAEDGGKGARLDNISYKSTGKHANVVLGITRTEDMAREKRMDLEVLKNRNGRRGVVQECHCDPEVMDLSPLGARSFERRKEAEPEPEPKAEPRTDPSGNIAPSPFRNRKAA